MYDFLDDLPGNVVDFADLPVRVEYLVDLLVLLDERQDQVVRGLPYLQLLHYQIEYLLVGEAHHHVAQLEHRLRHRRLVVAYQLA